MLLFDLGTPEESNVFYGTNGAATLLYSDVLYLFLMACNLEPTKTYMLLFDLGTPEESNVFYGTNGAATLLYSDVLYLFLMACNLEPTKTSAVNSPDCCWSILNFASFARCVP